MILKAEMTEKSIHILEPELSEALHTKYIAGTMICLHITKWSSSRSVRQNAMLHSLITRVRDSLGGLFADVKNQMCMELGFDVYRFIPETFEPPDYLVRFFKYHGDDYYRKSTTKYTVTEANVFIKNIAGICKDNNIDIDDIIQEDK